MYVSICNISKSDVFTIIFIRKSDFFDMKINLFFNLKLLF
jgi:hypothetical protein